MRIILKTTVTFAISALSMIAAAKSTLYLEHSNTLKFDQDRLSNCQILTGDVRFRQDDAVMYCDSAHYFSSKNSLNAYGHVRMTQGDSMRIYGDCLYYDGNTKLARMRNNIRMENGQITLYTDSLNNDRRAHTIYYFGHGTIIDNDSNVLKSVNGKFLQKTNIAVFQKDVEIDNSDMKFRSDSLEYHTKSHIAYIVAPSRITFDDAWINSTKGWYNTNSKESELFNRSVVYDYDGHNITADRMRYSSETKIVECFTNMVLTDSVNNLILKGGYGNYDTATDSAYAILKPTIIYIDDKTSDSTFIAADKFIYTKRDSITYMRGFYNVQIWGEDIQGLSDSVFYCTKDSICRMMGEPVVWEENNQSIGDSVLIYTKNSKVDYIETIGSAFMFMKEDTLYNQISGKMITCYIDSGKLNKVYVNGNALSVYFAKEDKDPDAPPSDTVKYIGVNTSKSSDMTIYIDTVTRKPKRIILTPASDGILHTPASIGNKEITRLKGLLDCFNLRPKDKYDIYNPKDKKSLKSAANERPKHKRKKR